MEKMVKTESEGHVETRIGIPVCDGPGVMRLVVTRPYHESGRIVEIPLPEVAEVAELEPSPLGVEPEPAD